jgi:hypothetical protein
MLKLAIVIFTIMLFIADALLETTAYQEFVYSETANKAGINNIPAELHVKNGELVYRNIVEPLRLLYPSLKVTSGYRNETLNKLVGGVPESQHLEGKAVDIVIKDADHLEVMRWIADNLEFDQLILEPSWIHISYSSTHNRKEILKYKDGIFSNLKL